MDLDHLITFFETTSDLPVLDEDYVNQCEALALQPSPQSSCVNQNTTLPKLSLLKAFCSDANTVRKYLQEDFELNNQGNEQQLTETVKTPLETLGFFIKNWFSNNETNNPCDTIDSLSPVPYPISSYISTDPLVVEYIYQCAINKTYDDLKLNFIFLVKCGYKLTLSLSMDASEAREVWNPIVGQKILSAHFSSLNLGSKFFSNDPELDGLESLLMAEACAAFRGQKYLNLIGNLHIRKQTKATPHKLISICNGIKGYRQIETNDKVTLLCNIYAHLYAMDTIVTYDPEIDGWDVPATDFKFDRRDAFLFNRFLHDGIVYIIETFSERLRNDINVIILLYLIIIFNPDVPNLKHPEIIRREQYSYIYLLRRYLRTIYKSDCEVSDNHYRLMSKIEQLRLLVGQVKEFFLLMGEPLVETVAKAVNIDSVANSKKND